jgi:NAD(P)-dependent dehydrogenase (short-subunit alcohol dehydrogenase family)
LNDDIAINEPTPLTAESLASATEILEQIANDRGLLNQLNSEQMHRLLSAAGRVAMPTRRDRKQLKKASRNRVQAENEQKKAADERLLAETGIRKKIGTRQRKKACAPRPFDPLPPPQVEQQAAHFGPKLNLPRTCYICKEDFDRLHFFYDSMCANCAELNWTRRNQMVDLKGRYALVTGGRVKIGYQAALKLLRAGAFVVVTTRFPRDGAARFLAEEDSQDWSDRLQLHGIDLRHTPSVEALAAHLCATLPRLDFILNNACQTVRRPPGFYAHLMEAERQLVDALPAAARPMLAAYEELRNQDAVEGGKPALALPRQVDESLAGIRRAAELSQIPLVAGDTVGGSEIFPEGKYDEDLQQVDLRKINSWRLGLADVPTVELLEVQLVNAIAPFILNARLKPLMVRIATQDKHIVNVSAMEGVFYRANKTDKHPHTNMAKAALNMLTRTSARDYISEGIHMNSVDTGWITDEDPAEIAKRKQEELGFHPPLDIIDAAARICDPFFHGLLTGKHVWGQFLKDYQVANW